MRKMRKTRKTVLKAKFHERVDPKGCVTRVLAVCDAALVGRVFRGRNGVLDLKTYASFYDGERVSEARAKELIKKAGNINLVGEKSVSAAREALGLRKGGEKRFAGVPHLQVYKV